MNNYMWLLETKYKDNNVRTINSDVFQTMKLPSMEIFKRNQYQTLYNEILSSDVTLAPANFGNHWCLLAIFPQLRMMMYLDSLYHGAHARERLSRECRTFCSAPCSFRRNNIHRWTGKSGFSITYVVRILVNRRILTIAGYLF